MVAEGMHINAIGGDCPGKTELQREILERSNIFVEFEPQSRIEGEIQQLSKDHPVTELWQVIRGETKGRDNAKQITIFDSVGFAIEDYSAIRFVYSLAKKYQLGEIIHLIPELTNPKDLYGLIEN